MSCLDGDREVANKHFAILWFARSPAHLLRTPFTAHFPPLPPDEDEEGVYSLWPVPLL